MASGIFPTTPTPRVEHPSPPLGLLSTQQPPDYLILFHKHKLRINGDGHALAATAPDEPDNPEYITADSCARADEASLECQHRWIQIVFPTVSVSRNDDQLPTLNASVVKSLTEEDSGLKYTRFIAWKILGIWGFNVQPQWGSGDQAVHHLDRFAWHPIYWKGAHHDDDERLTLLAKKPDFWNVHLLNIKRLECNLNPANHNVMRLSRIMDSLLSLGETMLAKAIFQAIQATESNRSLPTLKALWWTPLDKGGGPSQFDLWKQSFEAGERNRDALQTQIEAMHSE